MSTYAKLNRIIDRSKDISALTENDIDSSVQFLSENLARATGKDVGRLGVTVYDKDHTSHYCLDLVGDECRFVKQQAEDSRFGISVTKETWVEMVSGELAPMDAFLMGRMALSGDIDFGRRLYAKLATKVGRTDV